VTHPVEIMGCGGSAARQVPQGPPPISLQEITDMCTDMCTRMEILCAHTALQNKENFKIDAPPEVTELKNASDGLCKAADQVMADADASAAEQQKSGGMLGKITGAVTQGVGQVQGAGLIAASQALKGISSDLEKPFLEVGQDVIEKRKEDLYNILLAYINSFKFADPLKICRGDAPWSKEQYEAVPGDLISKTLHEQSEEALIKELKDTVTDEVAKHTVTTTWKSAQEKFNKCYDIAAGVLGAEKMKTLNEAGVKKVECQIDTWVTIQIVKALAKRMKECEIATRKDSAGKDIAQPKKAVTFAKVFSATPIAKPDYDFYMNEGKGTA
jgi:hypothetical protein